MSINLEIKCNTEDLILLENIIKNIGSELIYSSKQVDIYYIVEKGRLKIRDSIGEKSIIFYERIEDGSERWSNFFVKNVEKPIEWVNFFDLFLKRFVSVEKYRTLYHYKNSRIHLDKVSNLGNFIEIETKIIETEAQAKEEFQFLCNKLNLKKENQILKSYSDLLKSVKN